MPKFDVQIQKTLTAKNDKEAFSKFLKWLHKEEMKGDNCFEFNYPDMIVANSETGEGT